MDTPQDAAKLCPVRYELKGLISVGRRGLVHQRQGDTGDHLQDETEQGSAAKNIGPFGTGRNRMFCQAIRIIFCGNNFMVMRKREYLSSEMQKKCPVGQWIRMRLEFLEFRTFKVSRI